MNTRDGKKSGGASVRESAATVIETISGQLKNQSVIKIVQPIIVVVAALFLSGTELAMGVCPFGVALLCTTRGMVMTSAAFCGAVIGSSFIEDYSLWHIFILMLVYGTRLAVSAFAKGRKNKFTLQNAFGEEMIVRITISAVAAIGTGAVIIIGGANLYYDVFAAMLGVAMYPLFTAFFIMTLKNGEDSKKRLAGLCGVLFAVTMTLHGANFPFDLGAVFALAATLVITYTNGIPAGAAAGVFCGIAMEGMYAPLYPIAAIAFGLIIEYSAPTAVLAAAVGGICFAIKSGGFGAVNDILPEIIFTCAVLAPVFKLEVVPKKEIFAPYTEQAYPAAELKGRELERRLGNLSYSLEALSKLLYNVSDKMQRPTEAQAYRICTGARARFCSGCPNEDICSGTENAEVEAFFTTMRDKLCACGKVSAKIVPEQLARRCHNIDGILDAVNNSAKINSRFAVETGKTELFASDYLAIAGMLRETSRPDSKEWARDKDSEARLARTLSMRGFNFLCASVYGERNKRIYLRGVAMPGAAGERDIRRDSEIVLGCRLSEPEFSINKSNISVSMHTVPIINIQSGRYSSGCKKEKVSGDSVCSFQNDDGYYYTLVSDGMGSGREAAITSGVSSVFLENLLSGGCPMKSALEMLNCFIRGGEGECFTTVDLMEADLFTAKASFIKSGAAPSFVIRDGRLFRLHSKTVPVGIIRAIDAEIITFDLHENDIVIMISDGVTGSYEDCPWLYEMLCSDLVRSLSPASAARVIGEKAVEMTDGGDDITVCVMKIERNGEEKISIAV